MQYAGASPALACRVLPGLGELLEPAVGRAYTVRRRGCELWGTHETPGLKNQHHERGIVPCASLPFPADLAFQAEGRGFESRLPLF